jgi:hypothetical protein
MPETSETAGEELEACGCACEAPSRVEAAPC